MNNKKILCVDDDLNILEGYRRALRKDFEIYIAEGAAEGIAAVKEDGPFAVIIADMRMPGIDGIQFLSHVKNIAPETVRMMLTGNSDQQTAVDAVNEGNIFRFLTKPCLPEVLAKSIYAGLEQYELVTAEKQLLEDTLNNSLQVLVDMLAFVNPTAFSRATRVKKLAREIADDLSISNPWQVEIAAMLSQIGCISVPEEILQKITNGYGITDKEANLFYQHPKIAQDLIARIPRMEIVAKIVGSQNRRFNDELSVEMFCEEAEEVRLGGRILKTVLDFDRLLAAGEPPRAALKTLAGRSGWYDPAVLTCFSKIVHEKTDEYITRDVSIGALAPGMIINKFLVSTRGVLLLSPGQEITPSLIVRLKNFLEAGMIEDKIEVNMPVVENQNSSEFLFQLESA